jgi:hypothetical protein
MEKFLKTFKGKEHNYILTALLAIFVVFPVQIPEIVAQLVNNIIGKVIVIIISLNLFLINPMVGSIGLLAVYELIKRSENTQIQSPSHKYLPSEKNKFNHLSKVNQFPVTVEEMVLEFLRLKFLLWEYN